MTSRDIAAYFDTTGVGRRARIETRLAKHAANPASQWPAAQSR
jgi:hypothetical protein